MVFCNLSCFHDFTRPLPPPLITLLQTFNVQIQSSPPLARYPRKYMYSHLFYLFVILFSLSYITYEYLKYSCLFSKSPGFSRERDIIFLHSTKGFLDYNIPAFPCSESLFYFLNILW
jgi:hypothetical protein